MYLLSNPVEILHDCLAHAKYVAAPDIIYETKDFLKSKKSNTDVYVEKSRKPHTEEMVVVAMFPQTWSSTALGFGGLGGCAITTAYTVILMIDNVYYVYFNGRYAYAVKETTKERFDLFLNDINNRNMPSIDQAFERY